MASTELAIRLIRIGMRTCADMRAPVRPYGISVSDWCRPDSNYTEFNEPSSLSRAASSMGAAMFARVHSTCSARSLSAAGEESEAVALTEFLR